MTPAFAGARQSHSDLLVEKRGVARTAVGHEGVTGDDADPRRNLQLLDVNLLVICGSVGRRNGRHFRFL